MGTSLFGLKPKNTYQALLKTTDNTAIDATLKTISDGLGNDTPLQLSLRRVGVLTDTSVVTQVSAVIEATTVNSSLVIAPNGTGALVAQIPDGTVTGGNARGQNAVDLQMSRSNALQVASNSRSVIVGGNSNKATALDCVVVGGQGNTASGLQSFIGGGNSNTISAGTENVIVGGTLNNNSAAYGFVGAGFQNTVSSQYSVVSGGQSNTASTGTHATVVGGKSNTASNTNSIAGGGEQLTASNVNSLALGGFRNTASGYFSSIIGGQDNNNVGAYSLSANRDNNIKSTAPYSIGFGFGTKAYLFAQQTGGGYSYSSPEGAYQYSKVMAAKLDTLVSAGTTVLSLDGTGVTNLIIPSDNNRAWNVQVNWVAVVTTITGTATGITVGDVITSIDLLAFKKIGGISSASTHTSTATKTMVTTPAAYAACAIAYTAGASQEMALTFTGPTFVGGGSVTMRVVARIELSEVAW
jgi:hypothetical protein